MSESGPGLGYLVLFTEIGFTLLVTTLLGALGGRWLDERLGTVPLFSMLGFFAGLGIGTYGIYVMIRRFLATID